MLVRGSQGHVLSPDSVHYDLRVTPFHSCPLEIVFNAWWLSGPFMVALGAMPLCGSQGHTITWLPGPLFSPIYFLMSVSHVLQFARVNLI